MKISIFSSNQPRHLNLARTLASLADEVYLISEVNTIVPGEVKDFFQKSAVMRAYFSEVVQAERRIFGNLGFLPANVRTLALKSGDLNYVGREILSDALDADLYVVFGASFIKGWLVDFLVKRRAINIHMGLSPYYRGSSCNFWALFDDRPGYVGATIHLLSKGLDSGDILFHCLPTPNPNLTPFDFTMQSVSVAHSGLVDAIEDGSLFSNPGVGQDRSQEIRYTRNEDFNDEVAKDFLRRKLVIDRELVEYPELIAPRFG